MKPDIHPDYQFVVFQDLSEDFSFLTRSTLTSSETVTWEDGNEYPLVKVDITSASHPFYTGKMKLVDTAGRVDKFNRKYGTTPTTAPTVSNKRRRKIRDTVAAQEAEAAAEAELDAAAASPAATEKPAAEAAPAESGADDDA